MWNGNPMGVYSGGNGRSETAPTPWLLAYWSGEYYKL